MTITATAWARAAEYLNRADALCERAIEFELAADGDYLEAEIPCTPEGIETLRSKAAALYDEADELRARADVILDGARWPNGPRTATR